jgi:hypothetical protein
MSNTEQYRAAVEKWVEPVRALVQPMCEGFFAGRLDFSKMPMSLDTLSMRAMVALHVFPSGDRRDWNAIRVWAESLRPLLLQ